MLISDNKSDIYSKIFYTYFDIPKYQNDLKIFAVLKSLINTNTLSTAKINIAFGLLPTYSRKNTDDILSLIISKINNQISWYDYLESIISLFDKMHANLNESAFYTPFWLVDKILDKYNKNDFSKPCLKWFDPANGNGNFLLRLIQRLLIGLKNIPGLENEDDRYKWIVEKMIYAGELESIYMFNYMLFIDPMCKYDINVICGKFNDKLTNIRINDWEFNSETRILGNPPFKVKSGNPWLHFLNKSLQISNHVNFIVPISIMRSNSKTLKDCRKKLQPLYNLFDLNSDLDKNNFTENRIIISTFASKTPQSIIKLKDKLLTINNSEIINRIPESENKVFGILSKIEKKSNLNKLDFISDFRNNSRKTTPKELIKDGIASDIQTSIFKYPIHHTPCKILYAKDKMKTWGKLKVAFNYSGKLIGKNKYGQPYMFATTNLIGKQMAGVEVNTQEEADILLHNYSHKLFEFYNINEKSSGFNQGTLNNLPKLPLKKLSNKEIYDWFELTNEEISLIEDSIKR